MAIKSYSKYVYYFKSLGTCIFIFGGCWLVYQARETSQLLRSTLATNVLNLEQNQAHYIYLDSHQKDVYIYNNEDPAEGKPSLLNVVTKWWTSLNQSIAYRHFNVAKHGTKNQRTRAVYCLGALKHLQSWHYQHIAQMMDSRTAVALARIPDSDLRFFLKPPYHFVDKKLYEIIDQLYQLLVDMDKLCQSSHSCLIHFLHKKFYSSRKNLEFDHELSSTDFTATPTISWDEQLLMQCIEAIYHHTSIEQFSRNLADAHGLSALMEVKKKFADNIDVCVLLAKIISNLSMHSELLDVIFQSGWIGVLAAWSRHKDIRLAGPAARALFNLDEDANNGEKFPRRIYLLHPMNRTRTKPKADVVFIHGLLGGIFISWRQRDPDPSLKFVEPRSKESEDLLIKIVKEYPQEFLEDLAHDLQIREWKKIGHDYEIVLHDCPVSMNSLASGPFTCPGNEICTEYQENYLTRTECWPKDWLPNDVPSVRVIGINYDTSLSWWSPPCPIEILRSTISERSLEFTKKLVTAGVGKRPIIWVCHSMGGLLVKQMLVEESKTGDKHRLCDNTKGIIFYSTPHRGSHVATLKQTTQMLLWPSVEVQELREESPQLLKLHEEFKKMLEQYKMEIVSFSETKSTLVSALKVPLQIKFVLPESANPGVGEFYEIPQDHLSICKPASKHSFLYRKIVDVLKKMIADNNN
ncbi:protein SERAC1 [Microplitis demolitor]|uniref:protein SERAC1 n=1 Tax=Microplitis demolitor TaxID=69319 RepID=UPI0004CC9F4A|nr:protein SERAC1 [Microplitis demolitor]